MWLNSTLGLLGRWWVSNRQQQALAEVFDQFEHRAMLPANEAYRDEARQELDEAVLCGVLDLPTTILDPLSTLRLQWCAEPSVHGGKKTRP